MIIYLGCPEPMFAALNSADQRNVIIIDQKEHYQRNTHNYILQISIFDTDRIIRILKDKTLPRNTMIVPVADYAINAAYEIAKFLSLEPYDYRFMSSKLLSFDFLKQIGVVTVPLVEFDEISQKEYYIVNPLFSSESIGIKKVLGIDIKRQMLKNHIITKYIPGQLINVDLTFNKFDGILEKGDIYLRYNDNKLRTIITKNIFEDDHFEILLKHIIAKLEIGLKGYHGRLTLDMIWTGSEIYVIEISPFHHKPWMQKLSQKQYKQKKIEVHEVTVYRDNESKLIQNYENLKSAYKFKNENLKNNRIETRIYFMDVQ